MPSSLGDLFIVAEKACVRILRAGVPHSFLQGKKIKDPTGQKPLPFPLTWLSKPSLPPADKIQLRAF